MADKFQFDVFLSHSAKQKQVVLELTTLAKNANTRIYIGSNKSVVTGTAKDKD